METLQSKLRDALREARDAKDETEVKAVSAGLKHDFRLHITPETLVS